MKAVIYARYSSDNQTENSIEGQLRESKEFAERKGITIFGTYIDRALSAKTDNRPQFQKMIRDSAKGLFDVIIVWKLDRFARNRYDSAHYKAILRKNGVKVISATEPISEDATGILLESLLEGYAEFYSAELSEKVKRGLTENALKCKWNNGSRPVGYFVDDEQKLQIDTLTSPIILEAFKKYSEGEKVVDIVKFLADSGVKHYRGGTLRIDAVQRMFKNRVYIGEYKYGEHITPGGVPAIVPFHLFEQVQERMAKNKKAPARFKAEDEYLLTTRLLCGKCGAFMVGESGTSRVGKVHRYYKCVTAKKRKGCNKKSAQKDWIEDLVVAEAVKMLANDTLLNKIADLTMDLQRRENITLPLLKKQLAETEKGIENMLNAIQSGVLTSSTKKRLDELEASKSEIEVKILQEEMQKPRLTKEQILFWLHKFRGIDISKREHRQRLIDTFINAVYLYDDKIVLTFNFKEGAKTVTMGDVEESYGSDLTTSSAGYYQKKNTLPIFIGEVFFCVQENYGINYLMIFDKFYLTCDNIHVIITLIINFKEDYIMELTKLQEKIKKESQGNLAAAIIAGWGGVACGLCFLVITVLTAINPGVNHPSPETALQDLLSWSAPFIFNGFFVGCVSLFSAKLFHRIGKSHTPFSPENTKQLKAISRVSILMGLLLLSYNAVMGIAFDDQRLGIGAFALTYLIIGVIFDMFARIFEYGRQLQQESDETL